MLEIDDLLSMSISNMSGNISSSKKEKRLFIKQTIARCIGIFTCHMRTIILNN